MYCAFVCVDTNEVNWAVLKNSLKRGPGLPRIRALSTLVLILTNTFYCLCISHMHRISPYFYLSILLFTLLRIVLFKFYYKLECQPLLILEPS